MFTGIIEATAAVRTSRNGKLTLERPAMFHDLSVGMSICVSGVCLSISSFNASSMSFDVIGTTRSKTTLGYVKHGDRVNLERALPATGRFDGHIVLGHCEGTGRVVRMEAAVPNPNPNPPSSLLTIDLPSPLLPFVVPHGSIAIDGVSLTIASLKQSTVTVALIPLTLTDTTLGHLRAGDTVNLETDILGRYILHHQHAKRRNS